MATYVQTDYRRVLNEWAPGQIASGKNVSIDSARFDASGSLPDSVPFGYAVGWTGEQTVARSLARRPWALLKSQITNETAVEFKDNEWFPGTMHLAIGEYLIIGDEWMKVNAVRSTGVTVVRASYGSTQATHAADAPIYRATGGLTTFAGVAVKNVALPGTNSPVDTYNANDIVSVGCMGEFIVVCENAVSRGDTVSINIGSTAANYGLFSNKAEVNSSRSYLGVPGAVYMEDSRSITPYSGSTAMNLAKLRLNSQPR